MEESLAVEQSEPDPYVIDGWDSRAPSPGLSPAVSRRVRVVSEALFSTADGPPPAERLDWLVADLGDFCGHLSARGRFVFRACIATVYFIAPLLIGRFRTLAGLELDEQVRAIHRLEKTPLSLALLGAKALLCIVYYEHADAAAEIGWDQKCLKP